MYAYRSVLEDCIKGLMQRKPRDDEMYCCSLYIFRLEMLKTGVSVHTIGLPVIHAFEKSKNTVRHRIQQLYENVIPETQCYYGESYVSFCTYGYLFIICLSPRKKM